MSQRVVTNDQHCELLRMAFGQVQPDGDWKGPIDCIVPYDSANIYMQAIEFMTGVKPEAEVTHAMPYRAFRLTCVGYRRGPCGDH